PHSPTPRKVPLNHGGARVRASLPRRGVREDARDVDSEGRPTARARARAGVRVRDGDERARVGARETRGDDRARGSASERGDAQGGGTERGASELERPGWESDKAEACAARVRDALTSAEVLGSDLSDLCIERGVFAWRLMLDVVVLDDDGAAADAALSAAVAALRDVVLPEATVKRGKIVIGDEEEGVDGADDGMRKGTPLNVRTTPVCLTTALYKEHLLVDPTHAEEALSECEVSVVLTEDGMIRGVFKNGGEVEATEDILMKCIAAARLQYAASAKVILDASEDDDY
ncbi:Exosc8 protein, partial [Ostreococcus tauri]